MRQAAYFLPWNMAVFVTLATLVCFVIGVVIGICVGVDAGKRGIRPAAVWGIVAALAPGMTGLIAYLIVRHLDDKKRTDQEAEV